MTTERKKINFLKHYSEDSYKDNLEICYKTNQYAKKVRMRNEIVNMTYKNFMDSDLDVWELKYMSTSDEEDNDSDVDEDSEDESGEEENSEHSGDEDKKTEEESKVP